MPGFLTGWIKDSATKRRDPDGEWPTSVGGTQMVQPFSLGQLASPDTGSGRRPPTSLRAQRSNSDFRPDGLPRRFRLRSLSFGGQVAPLHKRFAFVAGNA